MTHPTAILYSSGVNHVVTTYFLQHRILCTKTYYILHYVEYIVITRQRQNQK